MRPFSSSRTCPAREYTDTSRGCRSLPNQFHVGSSAGQPQAPIFSFFPSGTGSCTKTSSGLRRQTTSRYSDCGFLLPIRSRSPDQFSQKGHGIGSQSFGPVVLGSALESI